MLGARRHGEEITLCNESMRHSGTVRPILTTSNMRVCKKSPKEGAAGKHKETPRWSPGHVALKVRTLLPTVRPLVGSCLHGDAEAASGGMGGVCTPA